MEWCEEACRHSNLGKATGVDNVEPTVWEAAGEHGAIMIAAALNASSREGKIPLVMKGGRAVSFYQIQRRPRPIPLLTYKDSTERIHRHATDKTNSCDTDPDVYGIDVICCVLGQFQGVRV